jgi:hypothetical protein
MQVRQLEPQCPQDRHVLQGWVALTPASLLPICKLPYAWFSSVSAGNLRKVMYLNLCHYRLLPRPSLLSLYPSFLILCFFLRFSPSASLHCSFHSFYKVIQRRPEISTYRSRNYLLHRNGAWRVIWYRSWNWFPPLGDTGRQDAPCSRMLQLAWRRDRRLKEMARTGSVLLSTQCCQVLFSSVNYFVGYNY